MLQNPRKTLGFKKDMVYKIPPEGGGGVNHIQPVAYKCYLLLTKILSEKKYSLALSLCTLGNVLCSDFFSKQSCFKKIFQEHYQSVKRFGSRSGPTFCRSWSGSKLFAKGLSADDENVATLNCYFIIYDGPCSAIGGEFDC